MIVDRIKLIRKNQKLSQSKFGEMLGVSRDVIKNIELKAVEPKELFIKALCAEFSVNEHWLRTGEGDMYIKKETNHELSKIVTDAVINDREDIKLGMTLFANLDEEQRELAIKLMQQMKKET